MNITHEQPQDQKPIQELSEENFNDILKVWKQYGSIPDKYIPALLETAKKGLRNDR